MARTSFVGFGAQAQLIDFLSTAALPSGCSYDTSIKRTGPASFKIVAPTNTDANIQLTSWAGKYFRFYIRLQSFSGMSGLQTRMLFNVNGALAVLLDANGQLNVRLQSSGLTIATHPTALSDNTKWYRVEVRIAAGTGDVIRIDGVGDGVGNTFAADLTLSSLVLGAVSDPNPGTYTVNYADLSADDTTWCGPGIVPFLVPVSSNSIGSGWQKPGGTATGLETSVDNTPPIGVADSTASAQAENMIRNASANTAYVANLTTYTNAGVGANDTVMGIQSHVLVGAPVSTSAKTGSQQLTSNPAAGAATAFAANSGQFWSGVAAGTFPTGWKRERVPIITSPTITKGSSPVLTVTITGGTTTRIAMVCQMGAYIDVATVAAVSVDSNVTQAKTGISTLTVDNNISSTGAPSKTGTTVGTILEQIVSAITQGRSGTTDGTVATASSSLDTAITQAKTGQTALTVDVAATSALTQARSGVTSLVVPITASSDLTQSKTSATTGTVSLSLSTSITQAKNSVSALTVDLTLQTTQTPARTGVTTGAIANNVASTFSRTPTGVVSLGVEVHVDSSATRTVSGVTTGSVTVTVNTTAAVARGGVTDGAVGVTLGSVLVQNRTQTTDLSTPRQVSSDITQARSGPTALIIEVGVSSTAQRGPSGPVAVEVVAVREVTSDSTQIRGGVTQASVTVLAASIAAALRSSITEAAAEITAHSILAQTRAGTGPGADVTELTLSSGVSSDVTLVVTSTTEGQIEVSAYSDATQIRNQTTALAIESLLSSIAQQIRTGHVDIEQFDPSLIVATIGKVFGVNTTPQLGTVKTEPKLSTVKSEPKLSAVKTTPTLKSVNTDPKFKELDTDPILLCTLPRK